MSDVLFLAHRLPYPPDKGDKVRSFHLLDHLRRRHRVHLGTFVDDPDDLRHLPALREQCASVHAAVLRPRAARLRSLGGLASGRALTLHYYADAGLRRWVDRTLQQHRIAAAVVFSSAMAPYVSGRADLPMLLDLVDVDSAKWAEYAPRHRWPMSWIYAREARRLLDHETRATQAARHAFLATDNEVALFRRLAPHVAGRVRAMNNGVDARFFDPALRPPSPFEADEVPLVFTGAMDYWPNVDAVQWFVSDVLPALRVRHPGLRLHIVGRNPAPAVRALSGLAVSVTGTVPDVRPYLAHARIVVAPLRLARGIQNKVLEAMAMARPVVAATACVEALTVNDGVEIVSAGSADEHRRRIDELLDDAPRAAAIGEAARRRVLSDYDWDAHLALLDRCLDETGLAPRPVAAAADTARWQPAGARE